MLNAVMLVCNRPQLTEQALGTLFGNSRLEQNLTIVDDCSDFAAGSIVLKYANRNRIKVTVLRPAHPVNVTARLRNLGVYWSEKMFGRGEYLYLSDNDAYFTEGWDEMLVKAYSVVRDRFKLLGPYRHPYHRPGVEITLGCGYVAASTDAVQGIGHFMEWDTWDKYGPLDDQGALGTNNSEDFAFCQRIVQDGFLVGSVQPELVHNCGLTGTAGKPSPGAEVMERIPGVLRL